MPSTPWSARQAITLDPPPASDVRPDALATLARVGGARLVRDLIALYTSYVPARLDEARGALAAGDAEGVQRACRAVKSGGAQLGLVAVAARCEQVERLARAGDVAALPSVLGAVEQEYRRACAWLARHPSHAAP